MKKLLNLFALLSLFMFVASSPMALAQADPIDLESNTTDTTTDTSVLDTTDEEATLSAEETKAGVPDTGFAPAENKLVASLGVFIIGASLGGALGFGLVQMKKKRFNS